MTTKAQIRIGGVIVSDHAVVRFQDRCHILVKTNRAKINDRQWCAEQIYAAFNRSEDVELTDAALRPWLIRVRLEPCESISFDKTTRIVMITKRVGNGIVIKTLFMAVCRECGTAKCKHVSDLVSSKGSSECLLCGNKARKGMTLCRRCEYVVDVIESDPDLLERAVEFVKG